MIRKLVFGECMLMSCTSTLDDSNLNDDQDARTTIKRGSLILIMPSYCLLPVKVIDQLQWYISRKMLTKVLLPHDFNTWMTQHDIRYYLGKHRCLQRFSPQLQNTSTTSKVEFVNDCLIKKGILPAALV